MAAFTPASHDLIHGLALPCCAADDARSASRLGGLAYSRLFYVPPYVVLCVLCVAATHTEHQAFWRCRAPKLAYSVDTPGSTLVNLDESHTTVYYGDGGTQDF